MGEKGAKLRGPSMHRRIFVPLVALLLAAPIVAAAQHQSVVVFVVRHAERAEDGTNDPPISDAGWDRARRIAGMMREARLTHIHTTDYKRTRSTIEPLAGATGVTPALYAAGDLDSFAQRLRSTPGRHLVVGHSNTNAELVAALGGDAGEPIGEMEYDRAYVVVVAPNGGVASVMFRFGGPSR